MTPRAQGSFYDLLEVSSNATFDEIESSYHRISAYLDAGSLAVYSMLDEDDVSRLRSELDEAFRTLSDADRRTAYDKAISDSGSSYPSVLVPAAHSGTNMSVGQVQRPEPADFITPSSQPAAPVAAPPPVVAAPPVAQPVVAVAEPVAPAPVAAPPPASPVRAPPPVRASSPVRPVRAVTQAPVAASGKRRLKPKLDQELTPDTEYSGALLRRLRESAEASIDDVAELTKINKRYLRAVEDNDFAALPAPVYVRGFVCEYARALSLDAEQVARSYMALYRRFKDGGT